MALSPPPAPRLLGRLCVRLRERHALDLDPVRLRRTLLLLALVASLPLGLYLCAGSSYTQLLGARGVLLDAEPWRLLTAWVVHASLSHLLGNLLCLVAFGLRVAYLLGTRRMLLLLCLVEIASSLSSALVHPDPLSVGASGISYALIGAFAMSFLIPLRSPPARLIGVLMLGWGVLSIFAADGPGVDSAAHAGGLLAGVIFGAALLRPRAAASGAAGTLPHTPTPQPEPLQTQTATGLSSPPGNE